MMHALSAVFFTLVLICALGTIVALLAGDAEAIARALGVRR